jgi:uncharacterized membrane protein
MSSEEQRDKRTYSNITQSTERIKALTDGVFAIAMTLLVLSLELPQAQSPTGDFFIIDLLLKQHDLIYNYFLSFILLAFFWIDHHNQFHYYQETDNNHLWINLSLLMFVALVPFTTVIVGDYPQYGAADIIFAVNIILISLLNYLNYWYAKRCGYLIADLPGVIDSRIRKRVFLVVGVCLLAVMLALFYSPASSFTFLLIPLLMVFPYFKS